MRNEGQVPVDIRRTGPLDLEVPTDAEKRREVITCIEMTVTMGGFPWEVIFYIVLEMDTGSFW